MKPPEYDHVSQIPEGELGSASNPHTAPWETAGLPYGAHFICGRCERHGQSTYSSDCFPSNTDPRIIICEACMHKELGEGLPDHIKRAIEGN